jgi:hypothetical protein
MRGNERERFISWEKLSNTKKHMILMYFYRVETEPMENLRFYIETLEFNKYGITREELPLAVQSLRGFALKRSAYEAIGKLHELSEGA